MPVLSRVRPLTQWPQRVYGRVYRVRVEEQVLAESFGAEYTEYAKATKRLVPWIY